MYLVKMYFGGGDHWNFHMLCQNDLNILYEWLKWAKVSENGSQNELWSIKQTICNQLKLNKQQYHIII